MSDPRPAVPTLPRSFLYVPGARPDLFAKASAGPADAVVLDLEDAVPLPEKARARFEVRDWLRGDHQRQAEQWVRVNAESLEEDLDAVVHPGLDGLFLAKCSVSGLQRTTEVLDGLETSRGLAAGSLRVVGLVESASGLLELSAMAAAPRLLAFGMGEVDLLADLRMRRTEGTAAAVDGLRARVVVESVAAGLSAPVAPTSTAFRDLDAFAESTRHLRDLGFRSRTAIHPSQVPVIHDVLTPGTTEVEAARDVVARFDSAAGGVTTDAQGRLIDAAVVREARETLSRASRDPGPGQASGPDRRR